MRQCSITAITQVTGESVFPINYLEDSGPPWFNLSLYRFMMNWSALVHDNVAHLIVSVKNLSPPFSQSPGLCSTHSTTHKKTQGEWGGVGSVYDLNKMKQIYSHSQESGT